MECFTIQNLSFSYPECREKAIDSLTLHVQQGEFLVLCGPSGCGKSTLLRQMKTVFTPHGVRVGEILFEGIPLQYVSQREQAEKIGFILQSPENQVVTDKVWHELAFGLESLGYDTPTIRRKVAEMASFFGIEGWFYKNVTELSGGQKQLLNLASVMAMQPSVLILDEPTSQLDPIAASDFLATLGKINRELGTTIILTEHRLEEAFPLASRVAVMDEGRLLCTGTPEAVGAKLKEAGHAMFLAMPTAMRVWAAVQSNTTCPVTVCQGRKWLTEYASNHPLNSLPDYRIPPQGETVVKAEQLWFKYEKDNPDVVRGLNLTLYRGELLTLLGGNGVGKSTTLKLLTGRQKPYRGSLKIMGSIASLPQNPQALFVKKTVREDLFEIFNGSEISKEVQRSRVAYVTNLCGLENLLDRHPYDLSGGEQQRSALAKVLLLDPEILLLDEPTKGLDASFKVVFGEILQSLLNRGVSILMVSHDIEFCAQYAHRCALFFDGNIVAEGTPRAFFSGNSFYTTSANRMARGLESEAITTEDIIALCGGDQLEKAKLPDIIPPLPEPKEESPDWKPPKLPWWRRLIATLTGAGALAVFFQATGSADLTLQVDKNGMTAMGFDMLIRYGVLTLCLLVCALAIGRRSAPPIVIQTAREKRKLSRRTVVASVLILMLVPLTLFVGWFYFGNRKYMATSVLVMLECMIPFFLVFEGRKPQTRELVIIAVLCAIGIAGRAAFFMLPQFKPVMALTIITGVAFGGETGFLVGAMTMLASNVLFSQGPWTPWQMFSMGIIGFFAGVLFRKGLLRRTRSSLCVFGAIVTFLVYGLIMNTASAMIWGGTLEWKILLTYYLTGVPMDCVHAAATVFFLWTVAEPMLEKLDRIKVKYGLVE